MTPNESTRVKYFRHEEILSPQGVLKVFVAHALMIHTVEMIIKLIHVLLYIYIIPYQSEWKIKVLK